MPDATRQRSHGEILRRFAEIIGTQDYAALDEVLAPECVIEYPQSREIIRGRENLRQILLNYPGGGPKADLERTTILGGEEHYVMTPTFNLVKVSGSGDTANAWIDALYPDGSKWFIIQFATIEAGKIVKTYNFFAPHFDPPEWRREWVELPEDR